MSHGTHVSSAPLQSKPTGKKDQGGGSSVQRGVSSELATPPAGAKTIKVTFCWTLLVFFFLTKKNRIPKEREREREKRPVAGFEGVDGDWTAVTSSLTCKQAPRQTQAPAPPASPKQLVEQRSFQVRNSVKLGKTR